MDSNCSEAPYEKMDIISVTCIGLDKNVFQLKQLCVTSLENYHEQDQ